MFNVRKYKKEIKKNRNFQIKYFYLFENQKYLKIFNFLYFVSKLFFSFNEKKIKNFVKINIFLKSFIFFAKTVKLTVIL